MGNAFEGESSTGAMHKQLFLFIGAGYLLLCITYHWNIYIITVTAIEGYTGREWWGTEGRKEERIGGGGGGGDVGVVRCPQSKNNKEESLSPLWEAIWWNV